jgi:hypothetical protein
VSCLHAWETKTEARKKSRRLPSRSRNQNPDASARFSHRRHRRSRGDASARRKCQAQAPDLNHGPRCRRGNGVDKRCAKPAHEASTAKGHPVEWPFALLHILSLLNRGTEIRAVQPRPHWCRRAPAPSPPIPCARYLQVPGLRAYRSAPSALLDPTRRWCAGQ